MFVLFSVALWLAMGYFGLSIFIDLQWINQISSVFNPAFAWFLVVFAANIPGFVFTFTLSSLVLNKKQKSQSLGHYPAVSVLIPCYNAGEDIIATIKSVLNQNYEGELIIRVVDDGSTDDTVRILEKSEVRAAIKLIKAEHHGKFNALNVGLERVDTKYIVTVDADTELHENAITNIVDEISSSGYAAVAGCLFVKNENQSFLAKLQQWDYTIGIFSIKYIQSFYNSTLVTQGAFSIYQTDIVKELGGWSDNLGEDIILTWKMLKQGYVTGFAASAVGFTDAPISYLKLGKQRERWARGMIEAFKVVRPFSTDKSSTYSRFLMFMNTFFVITDMATLIFYPLGLTFLVMGHPLLIGIMTVVLFPFTIVSFLIIEQKYKKSLQEAGVRLKKRNKAAFMLYMFFYTFMLSPFCLAGYFSEFFNRKKVWSEVHDKHKVVDS